MVKPKTRRPPYADRWTLPIRSLRGRSVHVREVASSDAKDLFSIVHQSRVRKHYLPPDTLAQFTEFIDLARELHAIGDAICLTVVDNHSRAPIGMYQLRRQKGGGDVAEWGFFTNPHLWGTTVFLESAALVLDFAFNALHLNRIEARVAVSNKRAAAALLKLGAVPEGVLRRSRRTGDEFVDDGLWAILRSDWAHALPSSAARPRSRHTLSRGMHMPPEP
jgi:RimJ/RimL family protein N-acetyltransferase